MQISRCFRFWFFLLVLVLLPACQKPPEQAPAPPALVRTIVLKQTSESGFRRFPGEVKALQTSELSFDVPGRMIERPATQGMMVRRGELLARLDPENFQARLASATARLTNAREEFQRRVQLRERGVISAAELDSFRTQFQVAEAAEREARRALEDTRLLAPFNGRVGRTLVNNFQTVQANQPILLFQNISQLEVDIEVPERVMLLGGQGLTVEQAREVIKARAEFPALPNRSFPLELKSFSTTATPGARTFRVTFLLDPPQDQSILPGMTCTVLVRRNLPGKQEGELERVFDVPVNAVGTEGGHAFVWKVNPGTMRVAPVNVEVDAPVGDQLRIRSEELQPGDEIVTTGVRFLRNGQEISRMPPAAN